MVSSSRLLFDIEAFCDPEVDDLVEGCRNLWCVSIKDLDTQENILYGPQELREAVDRLSQASFLVAHNGCGFDYLALEKLYGWKPKQGAVLRDSLTWAKLTHLALDAEDLASKRAEVRELNGSHSLKSWGIRLGCHKGDYTGGWSRWHREMGEYCKQDCEVLYQLVKHLEKQWYTEEALELEHKARWRSVRMTQRGYAFDLPAALKLKEEITATLTALEEKAAGMVAPVVTYEQQKKPDYWDVKVISTGEVVRKPTRGECDQWRKDNKIKPKDCEFLEGPPRIKEIVTPFNPGSRTQVRKYLFDRYQWVSPEVTEKGEGLIGQMTPAELAKEYGKLSEEVLRDLQWEDGQLFADIFLAKKALSFLHSKKGSGWLVDCKNGRIHHSMDTLGCVTSRCAHSGPNLGQVVSVEVDKEGNLIWGLAGRYGADFRSLYTASEGYTMVGVDESGIESRCLAHYLAPYDNSAYIREVLEGDIHALNVKAFIQYAGYKISRKASKSVYYAWCYGAGSLKLGRLMASPVNGAPEAVEEFTQRKNYYHRNPLKNDKKVWSGVLKKMRPATPEEAAWTVIGKKAAESLEKGISGLANLLAKLEEAAERGYIRVLDRRLPVRSPHAVLNTLLQGSAAIIGKKWLTTTFDHCEKEGVEAHLLAYIHDEIQSDVKIGQEEDYKALCLQCIEDAGKYYNFRIPLAGEAKAGQNWCSTH